MIGLLIVIAMLLPGSGSTSTGTVTPPAAGSGPGGVATGGAGSTTAPTPPPSVPTKFSDCMNGNWQSYTIKNLKFKNEGDCFVYVAVNDIIN